MRLPGLLEHSNGPARPVWSWTPNSLPWCLITMYLTTCPCTIWPRTREPLPTCVPIHVHDHGGHFLWGWRYTWRPQLTWHPLLQHPDKPFQDTHHGGPDQRGLQAAGHLPNRQPNIAACLLLTPAMHMTSPMPDLNGNVVTTWEELDGRHNPALHTSGLEFSDQSYRHFRQLSQPNSTSTRVGSDKVISWTTHSTTTTPPTT